MSYKRGVVLIDGLSYVDENQIKLKMVTAKGTASDTSVLKKRSIGQGTSIHVLYHSIKLHV